MSYYFAESIIMHKYIHNNRAQQLWQKQLSFLPISSFSRGDSLYNNSCKNFTLSEEMTGATYSFLPKIATYLQLIN